MALDVDKSAVACPSLFPAIRLARVVQFARDRLKSCIQQDAVWSIEMAHHSYHEVDQKQLIRTAMVAIETYIKPIKHFVPGQSRSQIMVPKARFASSLHALDSHNQEKDFSLRSKASKEDLFVMHDFHRISITRNNISSLRCVRDLTTSLLTRLQYLSGTSSEALFTSKVDEVTSDLAENNININRETFLANLEHVLRSLQQRALNAIVYYYLDVVEANISHWDQYWQYRKRASADWFAEWPNGQHPLNTTWPWNVKTSLLVLWGVCWMFYPGEGRSTPTARANLSGEDFWTRPLGQERQQSQPDAQPRGTQTWAGTESASNYPWSHHAPASDRPRRANERIPGNTLPVFPTSASTYPYIPPSPDPLSNLFPTSAIAWPYCQGTDASLVQTYAPNYNTWQPQPSNGGIPPTTSQRIDPNIPFQPYDIRQQRPFHQPTGGHAAGLELDLGLQLHDMQDYPSPSRSDVSGPSHSPCIPMAPGQELNPSVPVRASPSIAESSVSLQSSRRSQEPTRNTEGVLYCDHPECVQQPPTFARKSEWSKHMDKHTRPYVCEEPECENIRGFTYSGGLIRHRREVHRQHGGPKASCMCPHSDCKRSTGIGFSRKENLQEHLRRVHRDVNSDRIQDQPTNKSQGTTQALGDSRKRRRRVDDDGGRDDYEDEQNSQDLKQEVKKLRRELREKDERLQRLEDMVASLARSQETKPV